jgi:hypothetical protein
MRTRFSIAAALMLLALAIPPGVSAASGVPNNEPEGAIAVTAIPYSNTQSTSKATVNDLDGGCGAGGQDQATVWYTLTLAEATRVIVDTSGSAYFAGVNIYTAGPGSEILTCVGGAAVFDATAGQTYYIMIADIDGGRNGGRLVVSIDEGPPAFELGLSLDPNVSLDSDAGALTVSGTISCSTTADFVDISVDVSQTTGRFTTRGFGGTSVGCSAGETVAWSAEVFGETGPLGAGTTTVNASAFGCDPFTCDDANATETARVRR